MLVRVSSRINGRADPATGYIIGTASRGHHVDSTGPVGGRAPILVAAQGAPTMFARIGVMHSTAISSVCLAHCRQSDPEVVELSPGSKLCDGPPWLVASAGPRLGWLCRISILRKNPRIRAPFTASAIVRYATSPELLQSPLELSFFGR